MYSLGNSAPVINPGYYDVPIENKYSNPVREGNEVKVSNYNLNTTIGNTINNNNDNYEVYSSPTKPSPSLYIEQDASMSGYEYGHNMNDYKPVMAEKKKFYHKQVPGGYTPPQVIEKFGNQYEDEEDYHDLHEEFINNEDEESIPMRINNNQNFRSNMDGGRRDGKTTVGFQQLARNEQIANRPYKNQYPERRRRKYRNNSQQVYNNYIPNERPGINYYNNYLNVNSIPNIAGYYDNVIDDIISDDHNNTYQDNNIYYYNKQKEYQNKKNQIESIIPLEKSVILKETNIDSLKDIEKKEKKYMELEKKYMELEKKKKKLKLKKSKIDKPNAIYLVILLLIILILLVLYLIIKNPKRVRF